MKEGKLMGEAKRRGKSDQRSSPRPLDQVSKQRRLTSSVAAG